MKKLRFKLSTAVIVNLLLFAFISNSAAACGPFFTHYIYTPEDIDIYYPLQENKTLFDSNYDFILSNWGPEYFYPIYMKLSDKKLAPAVEKELLLYYENNYFGTENQKRAIDEWQQTRKLVIEEETQIDDYMRYKDSYYSFTNCSPDAFLTAKKTLTERIKIYDKQQLKSWLKQQDDVFSNCGGVFDKEIILSEKQNVFAKISSFLLDIKNFFSRINKGSKTKKELSPKELLEYDKEYQQAAIDFYQGSLEAAERKFKNIADNDNHPWREYAALVIGRIYIRRAQLGVVEKYDNSADIEDIKKAEIIRKREFKKAQEQFERILKDDSLSSVHKGARDLRNYILFRLEPKERFKIADAVLLNSKDLEEIIYNIEDFSLLWYQKLYKKVVDEKVDEEYREFEKFILQKGGDFSQWLYAWWNPEQNNLDLALKKYQETKSTAWLLASIKLMTVKHSSKNKIIQDVEKISEDSPVYLTANYYRLKLLIASDQKQEAKDELESLLKTINFDKTPIAKNYFMNLRMLVSENLEEALSYSLRKVVSNYWDYFQPYLYQYSPLEPQKNNLLLDEKIKKTFNELVPLAKWTAVVLNENILTAEIRKQMGLITFIRAALFDDWQIAQKMADFLALNDNLLRDDLSSFRVAKNQQEKKFTAALFILEYAGLNHFLDLRFDQTLVGDFSIKGRDDYRSRNWWCNKETKSEYLGFFDIDRNYQSQEGLNQFLSEEQIKQARLENETIYNIVAANFLAGIVIDYASRYQYDLRVPKALHLAVEVTHYSQCVNEKTTEFSRQAFQILHKNYPGTYWAKQTPYWY